MEKKAYLYIITAASLWGCIGVFLKLLTAAGLSPHHVEVLTQCTGCHPELWWSHRKMGDQRGNQAAMIQLIP